MALQIPLKLWPTSSWPAYSSSMVMGNRPCSIDVHDTFGPTVAYSCLNGFDFTLLFEESVLTLLPLLLTVVILIPRAIFLRKTAPKAKRSWLFALKCVTYSIYIVLQIILLALLARQDTPSTRLTVPLAVAVVASFIWLLYVSYLEHVRCVRPSTILCLYFGISALLDLARLRTLFFIPDYHITALVNLTSYAVKLVLLVLEVTEKRSLLLWQWKDTSPEDVASYYSRVLFLWLNRVFIRGYNTRLTVDSLTPLDQDILTASRPTKLEQRWAKAEKSSKGALLWVFVCHYKWALLGGVLPRLTYITFTFVEPLLVERTLNFTSEPESPNSTNIAYGLIGAYALVHLGKAMSLAWYEHMTYRALTLFRGSLVTLIFGKTLRLSTSAVKDAEAITLMSADIDRIGLSMQIIHDAYAAVVELALSLWLLSRLLGIAVLPPTLFIVGKYDPGSLCLGFGIPIASAAGNAQVPWLEAIEKRLAVTSKMVGTMKVIRMTGLTETIHGIVTSLRSKEIRASRAFRLLSVLQTGAANCTFTFAPVLGLGTFAILAKVNNTEALTEGMAFAVLSLFNLQDRPVMSLLHGFEDFQTIYNAFYRIQTYLLSAEREDSRATPLYQQPETSSDESLPKISTTVASGHGVLTKVVDNNSETSVIRLTEASGGYTPETMILEGINLGISGGKVTMIVGPVGSGKSTLLRLLLGELPQVSGSIVSDFSKCAYAPQSPWITWGTVRSNILGMSPWDAGWYRKVVCACSLDGDFEGLPDGDQTKTGIRGSHLSGGQQIRVSLARALYSRNKLLVLDDVLTGLDRTTEAAVLEAVFNEDGILKNTGSTIVLATNSAGHLRYADHIIVLNTEGDIAEQGTLEDVSASGGYVHRLESLPVAETSRQETLEVPEEVYQELGLENEDDELDASHRASDWQVYTYYIRVAGVWTFSAYLVICAAYIFGLSFPSIWLQWWTHYNKEHPNDNIGYWLGVYFALASLAIAGCMASDWAFRMMVVPKTSRKFHELLLDTTMYATTSFLTSTNVGITTNRFSQDLQLIDSDLPQSLDECVMNFLGVLISAVLVFTGSGYVAATIPACVAVIFFVQMFYLRTSRQLRLLDIEAKAPLFSHFIETLGGIACIRAYGWSEQYMDRSYDVLDASQKPYYLMWCIQRWLTVVLDLLAGAIAVMLVAFATLVRNGSTGLLGVALFNVISFSGALQSLVTQWTQLETGLGAISRVKTFVEETKSEKREGETDDGLPDTWPAAGYIILDNVSASYESSTAPVVDGFNLAIQPGEKIALCGRTGSGKSSLLLAILGMLDLNEGSITIDGYATGKISRETLRSRLNILPQEPFFLYGSVRENMDPLHILTDERIIETLRAVRLWDLLDSRGGLDASMDEDALSHGQRQLFCLARAIARPGKILIIDEATSSVDAETDELMQRVLREELQGRTLIAIAHKLNTVLDFDRVVLIDKGKPMESGNPQELLADPASMFSKLYRSGSSQAA
uniref:ABC transporter n=1 Tax=Bionectria ochroleuca TaxID=29856 RepID=A0A8H7NNV7_BIOOC